MDHVVIRARELERMVAFYCDVIGCSIERREEESRLSDLMSRDVHITPRTPSGQYRQRTRGGCDANDSEAGLDELAVAGDAGRT
ncbi:MAG: VOC family protein [Blastocatellia bacterium]